MTTDVITAARRRTRRLILLIAGIGLLIAALVYPLGLYADSRLDGAAPAPTGSPDWPTPSLSAPPQVVSVILPPDTTWTTVAGVSLPVSATAGPRHRDHGVVSQFAHTRTGAALAAVHLLVNTTPQVGATVFEPTLRTHVVGANAAAMRNAVEADYGSLAGDAANTGPVGSLTAAIAGARLSAYTDAAAHIDLLTVAVDASGTPHFAATPVDLTWNHDDWALVAPPEGRWDGVIQTVPADRAASYPPLGTGR